MREYNKIIVKKLIDVAVKTALNLFLGVLMVMAIGGILGVIYNLIF
tara:strand:- start:393 stop:530 length:138 start_codon:yes stop_codon:yes gene_type:complete